MNRSSIIALHGFLGHPSDWKHCGLQEARAVDLFSAPYSLHLDQWGEQFNARLSSFEIESPVLLGYSLGGRLALHALIQNPALYKSAVIISSHPGIADKEKRLERLAQDKEWAKRFRQEEWNQIIERWNQQSIFKTSASPFQRLEKDYHRESLAQALECASLGVQEDLRGKIKTLPLPILWIVGENDTKYCALAESLSFSHPASKVVKIPSAGHRTPWDQPLAFNELLDLL